VTSGAAPDPASAVAEALAVLDIPSSMSHSWMGEVVHLPEVVARVCDRNGMRKALVGSICSTLYDCFYTQGAPRPTRRAGEVAGTERTMSHELSAANAGAGCLEPGWRVVGEDGGRHVVQRGGLRLWVAAEEIAGGTATGDDVALRLPAELPLYSPGFYIARGDRGFSAELPRVLDRFYFDVRPEGAVPFVREATRRLNQAGLAFSAKVVDDPSAFDRADSAVLAVERRDRRRALVAAEDLRTAIAAFLDDHTPAMTLRMGPGLAFAEDPGDGLGFGWHRCGLVADAVVRAAERGLAASEERLQAVRERFAEAGISLDAPHLGPPADAAASAPDLPVAVGA
jgi:hypothetical protein